MQLMMLDDESFRGRIDDAIDTGLEAASATERVRNPGVSKLPLSGTMPAVDQRPIVTLRPTLPVTLAGMRTEPPVSVPNASTADPSAMLTPAPELEPPVPLCSEATHRMRGGSQGAVVPTPPKRELTMRIKASEIALSPSSV